MAAWVAWCVRLGVADDPAEQRGRPRAASASCRSRASSSATISAAMTVSRASPNLAELAAQRDDASSRSLQLLKMALLAVLAGHSELAAIDGDVSPATQRSSSNQSCDSRARRMFSIAASNRAAMSRFAVSSLRVFRLGVELGASLERSVSSA
jgi:hypothetical protein